MKSRHPNWKSLLSPFTLNSIHLILDFDHTITTPDSASTHTILYSARKLDFNRKSDEIYDKYRAIELDPSIPIKQKTKYMREWTLANNASIVEANFTKEEFMDLSVKAKVNIRSGTDQLCNFCKERQIPLLILSAGIGNIVLDLLTKFQLHSSCVVSNMAQFDTQGNIAGFHDICVDAFSKGETDLSCTEYAPLVKMRRHAIIIGDGLGDVSMGDSLEHDLVFKVGFCNSVEKLDSYLNAYDLVLSRNDGFEAILEIIQDIENRSKI